jgi:hypothetical protein
VHRLQVGTGDWFSPPDGSRDLGDPLIVTTFAKGAAADEGKSGSGWASAAAGE